MDVNKKKGKNNVEEARRKLPVGGSLNIALNVFRGGGTRYRGSTAFWGSGRSISPKKGRGLSTGGKGEEKKD